MRNRGHSGVWELFLPELPAGSLYKFEIRNRDTGAVLVKTDRETWDWQDEAWMSARAGHDWLHTPCSIYEVHLGSWQRDENGDFLNYRELAHRLVDYVLETGFTPRWMPPGACHRHGIGVLLDWVPAHFPKDEFALARFDGTALYEHEDPRRGEHRDWGTLIYNFGRNEVKNFLLASALYWLEEYHIDGLRVDAVASMLYLDYSRDPHDWVPNIHGGNENLEAIAFLRELNTLTHAEQPGTIVVAEESTAWPQVTRPVNIGGLGFSMKWNMGWMHDTLAYLQHDPIHRRYHHDHTARARCSARCPATNGSADWYVLQYPFHQGVKNLIADLNRIYRETPALFEHEFEPEGFAWIDCHDSDQSVLSYLRRAGTEVRAVVLNFTPVPREGYRIGVPYPGPWREVFNSDSEYYGGSNIGNGAGLVAEDIPWMGWRRPGGRGHPVDGLSPFPDPDRPAAGRRDPGTGGLKR